jgi:DNA polymerase-3 subunit alpha
MVPRVQVEEFVHLHVHSEYSLLDGAMRTKKLLKELVARGASAVALTDHDGMHGILELYLEAQKKDYYPPDSKGRLNVIPGYEANVELFCEPGSQKCGHLVLLAENDAGYRNLIKLCSIANTVNKNLHGPETIVVTWDNLRRFSEGLVCLTGDMRGELFQLVAAGDRDAARRLVQEMRGVFGAENLFVEICDNNIPEQRRVNPLLAELAAQESIPLVATGDVHYIKPRDQDTHLSLLAIKHKLQRSDLKDVDRSYTFHLGTTDEMVGRFAAYPEAVANTRVIAGRCRVNIDTKSIFMPDYRQRPDEPADDCLVRLAKEGLVARRPEIKRWMKDAFNETVWKQYEERLEYEISVILKMKFSGYFLIVQDFICWAKDHGIPVGPGRGSAAGSLVTYALRITDIDPLRFNLLFERFLNPERISMPDIDTDFCQDRRGEVLDYVYKKYGEKAVAQIVTFGRMKAKNALKNLARIWDWSFRDADEFAKLIPEKPDITLESALKEEERIRQRLESDERARALWDGALEIEGILNSLGIHAAGVIISDSALDNRCPLMESDGQLLTQYEYKLAEKIGLIKFDFLGLKTLTVIDKGVKMVRERHCPDFNIEHVDIEDPEVYKMLSTAHLTGVFQLESAGMRKLISELQPSCFSDIVAVLALFRPGPLGSGMVTDFVDRKHGRAPVEYPFPELEPILSDTYGVMVFQEQVQKIAAVLANYTMGEADLLRRAMGKKDRAEMERQKARFVEGASQNGHNPEKVSEFFDLIAKFAEYGFNKSHTAAYGYVCFQTAYLKTYYPTEFMASIMSSDLDNTDKIVSYVADCRRMGIRLLPPSVNSAEFGFTIPSDRCIQFGLGAIKGLGRGVVDAIVDERRARGPFRSVPEFIVRVEPRRLNKKVMESLIRAGAFDSMATNRAELMGNIDSWLRAIAKEMECSGQGGDGLFGSLFGAAGSATSSAPARSRSAFKSAEPKPLPEMAEIVRKVIDYRRKKYCHYFPLARPSEIVPEGSAFAHLMLGVRLTPVRPWSLDEQIAGELATLGFSITAHPADTLREDLESLSQVSLDKVIFHVESADVPSFKRKSVKVAGVLTMVVEGRDKEGRPFARYRLEDGLGSLEMSLFDRQYAALERKFVAGETVWAEVQLKRGSEADSVRGSVVAMGLLADRRIAEVKGLVILADDSFAKDPSRARELRDHLERHRGQTPLALDMLVADEKARLLVCLPTICPSDAFIRGIEDRWPGDVFVKRCYRVTDFPMKGNL